jgi:ABC-type polysaccharide/polyol phosphate export permease
LEAVPAAVQGLMSLNPVYVLATAYRASLLGGQVVPVFDLTVLAVVSFGLLTLSLTLFRRVKGYFSAVI